ncbi:proprotein convertase P-domain-containing protein [Streptomyces canus]|uniref:proprotein convertase P-domain-containing protein n=1 Tax=Streptomyces canus TaxID=58343 RepID=UPI002E287042|nr:proprotein convertase P-domain-containing protein [Streptomyces canus]
MKRRIWTTVATAMAVVTLGALPAHADGPADTAVATTTADDPVDAPLYDKAADGSTVRVIVVTENRDDLSSAASAGETVMSYATLPMVTLRVDKDGLDELAAQDGVVSVTEDTLAEPTLDESIPVIGADHAIKAGKTGKGSAIAVIDTGVATNHPFLAGRVVSEACFSPIDAAYGATSLCGNGAATQEGSGAANSAAGACATMEGCEHGTHVAGIAAGDGTGIAGAPATGVAPDADIVAMQVFSKFDSAKYCGTAAATPCVRSFTSAQIAALEKVWQLKQGGTPIVAANLSLGSASYTSACTKDARKTAIDKLFDAGVATVVAAGNNGLATAVNAPACVPNAVSVGATTDDDEIASFSNRGPLLDLFAPGNGIISSVPGGGYDSLSGTSMATPHVTGALAVLRQAYPAEGLAGLVSLLATTGKPVTDEAGVSVPRIDVGKAVAAVDPKPEADKKPRAFQVDNDKDIAIPDAPTGGIGTPVTSPLTVAEYPGNAPKNLKAFVNVTHAYRGDIKLELLSPSGATYLLKSASATDGADDIVAEFAVDASASPANGVWKLRMTDTDDGDAGTLTTWSLIFPTPFENTTAKTVPDTGTVPSTIDVTGIDGNAAGPLQVYANITHTKIGDLRLVLTSPDGKSYTLKPYGSEAGGTLQTTYGVDATDAVANGTWTLKVTDSATGSTGELKGWSLGFPSYENQTVKAIPDKNYTEIWTKTSGLSGVGSAKLQVYVHVEHEYLGDLKIDLIAPDGSMHLLKDNGEQAGGTLKKVYTLDATDLPVNGWWKLRVDDVATGDTGTVNNFVVRF